MKISTLLAASFAAVASLCGSQAIADEKPAGNWSGFYIGLNAGYHWNADRDVSFSSTLNTGFFPALGQGATGTTDRLHGGFIGGGQAGYNMQSGILVTGIEMDLQGLTTHASSSVTNSQAHPIAGLIITDLSETHKVSWLGTLRGRAGVTLNPDLLVYATGGLAFGEASFSANTFQRLTAFPATNPGLSSMSESGIRVGWTIGAGAELMLSSKWSAKLEYLYYDLGSASPIGAFVYPNVATVIGTNSATAHFSDHVVRVGVNFRLD